MSNADDDITASDQALLRALAEAITEPPLPADLLARCDGLLSWIDVDAELAELLAEPSGELAGTRGGDASTTLQFTVADGSCVIEIETVERTLQGQLLGGDARAAILRTSTGATYPVNVDELGAFKITNPPRGTARLEIDLADGRRVRTDWFVT